jgi:hypothetical protein
VADARRITSAGAPGSTFSGAGDGLLWSSFERRRQTCVIFVTQVLSRTIRNPVCHTKSTDIRATIVSRHTLSGNEEAVKGSHTTAAGAALPVASGRPAKG